MKKLWIMLMATMCVGMAQAQTWKHIVSGGDLEDGNTCIEVMCNTEGYVVEKGYPAPVAGAGMVGTKGVAVVCPASSTQSWDPQMWIVLSESVTEGETIKIEFDYKATMPISIVTNYQDDNGYLYDSNDIGILECNGEWQHFSQNIALPGANQWASTSEVSRICFLLGNMNGSRTEDVTFYIDNVSVQKLEYENADVTGECGVGLKWNFNQATGVLTIDGEGAMEPYTYKVTEEGYVSTAPWYAYNEEIRSIRVNEGVTSIGNFAFMDLPRLSNVKLPSTLTTLGGYAFWGCISLKNITLPESVSKLGVGTFRQCGLSYINLPWRITAIPDQCFYVCGSLQSIGFSPNISRIGDQAFAQCQWMQYITLPASLETIGNSAFSLTGLKSIVIPKIVQGIGEAAFSESKLESVTFEGFPEQIGQQTFAYCQNLTEVILPEGFTTIPYAGFMMCTSLTDIVLPGSVTNIESSAFMYCPIQSVTCLAPEPPTCGTDVFDVDTQTYMINAQLFVPDGTYDAYYNDVPWGFFQNIEELEPEQPEVLAGTCGENLTWSIDREAWILYITGTGAMTDYGYSDSKKAPWSDYAQYIGHVVIGEGVTTIGNFAFRDLATTLDFTLPEGLDSIGKNAFWGCASIESITLPSTLKAIPSSAFVDCWNLQSIVIPEGVKSIADQAFAYCTALEAVTLPSTLESIGDRCFSNCESLKEITLPATVKSIGTYAFDMCVTLQDVTCLGNVPPTLAADAFNTAPLGAEWVIPATLHVPAGKVGTYREAEVWKTFRDIVALPAEHEWECTHIQGDVNGDGKVTIADVNRLIEILKKLKIEN